jgi:dual specificity protein kinase YAK1
VAKQTHKFFKRTSVAGADDAYDGPSQYVLLSEEEIEARDGQKPAAGKRYFKHTTLDDIIIHYSIMRGTTEEERKKETLTRIAFVDFLRGLMEFDPVRRWTPQQVILAYSVVLLCVSLLL